MELGNSVFSWQKPVIYQADDFGDACDHGNKYGVFVSSWSPCLVIRCQTRAHEKMFLYNLLGVYHRINSTHSILLLRTKSERGYILRVPRLGPDLEGAIHHSMLIFQEKNGDRAMWQ